MSTVTVALTVTVFSYSLIYWTSSKIYCATKFILRFPPFSLSTHSSFTTLLRHCYCIQRRQRGGSMTTAPVCRLDAIGPEHKTCQNVAVFRITVTYQVGLNCGTKSKTYALTHDSCVKHVEDAARWFGCQESEFWKNILRGGRPLELTFHVDNMTVLEDW